MPLSSSPTADAWSRIERVLAAQMPALHEALAPPASDTDLDALARQTGLDLVETLAPLYAHHDGQTIPVPGLFAGFHFLSAREAADEWGRWSEMLQGDPSLLTDIPVAARPEGTVRPVYASPGWLPFAADGAGNHLALDFSPGPEGTPGQVISFGPDEAVRYRLAASPSAFLAWFADALEAGRVAPAPDSGAPGGLALHIDGAAHLLDALPGLLGPDGLR